MGSLATREGVDLPTKIGLTTIDAHCAAERLARVDFMKVDVEGAELHAFRGAEQLLRGAEAPIILYECSELLTAPFGTNASEIKQLLTDYGYRIYRFDGDRLQHIPVAERHDEIEDVFALKPRHFELHPRLAQMRDRA